jgi:hypothetical protein
MNWRYWVKYHTLWNKAPAPGDLVEVGWDSMSDQPFIGVVTEIRDAVFEERDRQQAFGCVLVNGKPKWCDIYDLKPVTSVKKNDDAS